MCTTYVHCIRVLHMCTLEASTQLPVTLRMARLTVEGVPTRPRLPDRYGYDASCPQVEAMKHAPYGRAYPMYMHPMGMCPMRMHPMHTHPMGMHPMHRHPMRMDPIRMHPMGRHTLRIRSKR
jgi:hypothetical protein